MTALEAANYILTLADEEKGEIISNLKLQKLLYYCQGYHLALFDKPLFAESIVAWQYGPVVREAYHYFKEFGNGAIPAPQSKSFSEDLEESIGLIDDVYGLYGQFSAIKLMDMTHSELPWLTTNINDEIGHEKLKNFFIKYVEK